MRWTSLVCLWLAVLPLVAHAWLRPLYEDAEVVARSPLIVVGHLKPGTVSYVDTTSGSGHSWEHHATLVITEILKGASPEKEIPVIIHYGLEPALDGKPMNPYNGDRKGPLDDINCEKATLSLYDSGNSMRGSSDLVKNLRDDHLWLLRRLGGELGREPDEHNDFGILDPEDIQPISLKDYLRCYLADDPEPLVKQYAVPPSEAKPPDDAAIQRRHRSSEFSRERTVYLRVQRYLDHREIQRILKIADLKERSAKLLPYFLRRCYWNFKFEAGEGLRACGDPAGALLEKCFVDPQYAKLRDDIILNWGNMQYRPAVPILIDLLKQHDTYWATQTLEKGWWNANVGSELTEKRRKIYGEVYYAVCSLRKFHDPQARAAITLTLNCWQAAQFENTQIVEECEHALNELDAANK